MTPSPLAFLSFGFTEMLVVGVVALLVFGGELPQVMRNVGRAYAKFRQGLNEVSRPVRDEIRNVTNVAPPTRKRPGSGPEASSPPYGLDEPATPGAATETTEPAPRKPRAPDPWLADEPPPV